ncbi:phage tail tape measure protein [Chryseobacterium indoltheticum]|uniref:phage tail tape measure protein n=1 Tax=Chryseobacterium indoltheticum TaxID=254 RepID=UPI0028F01425|nr:phage tail tape measure protein [Chryseobacterium indoltheticum]
MAKVISDEILKLKIIVNGDEAQKRVLDLEQANKVLSTRLKDLNEKEKDLDKQRKAEEKILKSNTDKIGKYNIKLKETELLVISEVRNLRKKQEAYQQSSKEYEKIQVKIDKVKEKAEAAANAINEEIEGLTTQQSKFQENFDKATKSYKDLRKEIEETKEAIADNKTKIDDEVGSMNIMNMTIDQLTKRAKDLKEAMRHMTEGETLDNTREELQQINDRIGELSNGPESDGFLDKFNEYIGVIAAAVASVAGFLMKMQEVVDLNNELVDAQTAVSKTTGMTTEEVKELTAAYLDFDTRTNQLDLLKIAEIGGRLGVPKAEIQDFTREVDKAYVALGDSFSGGVEKVAEKIGKIKGLFKETKELKFGEAMNEIGSGLNELGADGAASEENIADFALRMGQLPEALKPAISETMGLGAAFEESGIDAERASSGYMTFIRTAGKETAGFAKVMGITQKEVEKLLNADPLQFFLKFSEGAKGLDPVKLAQILDGLKLNSGEVISIIGAASENTDKFRKSIELSGQAMDEATSLQDEFNKVNNNAAAIYEKLQKKWKEVYTSEKVAKVLNYLIQTIGKLLGVVEDTSGGVTIFRESLFFLTKIITIAVVSIFSYNTALAISELTLARIKERLLAYTVVQKVNNLLNQASTVLQNLWNVTLGYSALALGRLTGSTNLQTIAQQRLNMVTAANPWAAVLTIVMAVITAYALFKSAAEEAAAASTKQSRALEFQGDVSKRINDEEAKSAAELKTKVEPLIKVLKDKNTQLSERKKAYDELIKIAPEFKGTLDAEFIATSKLDKVYSSLIDKIKTAAKVRALQAILDEQYQKKEKLVGKQEIFKAGEEKLKKEKGPQNQLKPDIKMQLVSGLVDKTNKDIEELDGNIDDIVKKIADAKIDKTEAVSDYQPIPEKDKKKKLTDEEKAARKAENAYQAMRKKILDHTEDYDQKELELEAQKQEALAEQKKDGYDKERALLEAEGKKRIAELTKQKYQQSDFDDIDKIIAREKGDLQKQFIAIKEQWLRENKLVEDTIVSEKEKTRLKLLTLEEKFTTEAIKKDEEALQRRLNLITREQNETISQKVTVSQQKEFLASKGYSDESLRLIDNWEAGKAEIEKYYQKQSLEQQVLFFQEQIELFEMVSEVAPDLLTDDQLQTIQQYKDKIAGLVAEITKLKKGEEQKLGGKLSSFGAGNADLFGLTQDQWKAMFTNTDNLSEKIQKVGAATQIAQNMFSAFSSFVQANEQRMLQKMEVSSDRKKKKLKSQLDSGLITQETYKKETEALDAELDKKKAELEYKAAKRQRDLQIAQAISGVAMAVINAAQTQPFFPLGLAMTVLAGAMGAVQLSTIMSTPLPSAPGAEDGLYPVLRSQDNKLFKARKRQSKTGIYDEPTMLVGEAGPTMPELVVSGKTMKKIDPNIQKMYMEEIRRVEGFENGLYPKQTVSSGNDEMLIKAMEVIKDNTEIMTYLRDYGVRGVFEKSARTGKDIVDMQDEYKNLRNKNKH